VVFDGIEQSITEKYHGNTGKNAIHSSIFVEGKYLSSTTPVPMPPKEYGPNYYVPQLVVISVIAEEYMFREEVSVLEDHVDEQVNDHLIRGSLVAGIVGLVMVVGVIYIVSLSIAKPLQWMNEVGDRIVNDFGTGRVNVSNNEKSPRVPFSPTTKISDILEQFQLMLKQFNGTGITKLFKRETSTEVRNPFKQVSQFLRLTEAQRLMDSIIHTKMGPLPFMQVHKNDDEECFQFIKRVQWGHNVHGSVATTFASNLQELVDEAGANKKLLCSHLFCWIVLSIAVQLHILMIVIPVLVAFKVSQTFPDIMDYVEAVYDNFEPTSL
jgi:hypothetical protein